VLLTKKLIKESSGKYLISTKDSYVSESFVRELQVHYSDYKVSVCRDIEDFLRVFDRGTMFEDTKYVIVLWDFVKEDVDIVDSILATPTDDVLVFFERKVISKTKAYTRIKSLCGCAKLDTPKEKACITYAQQVLKTLGVDCKNRVPDLLVSRVGNDMSAINLAVKKLSYYSEGKTVTETMCTDVVENSNDVNYFSFSENFFKRRIPEVFSELDKIDDYSYVKLVHFLIGQIDRIYRVSIYKEQGKSSQDIADLMGLPQFILKTKFFTVLASYGKMKLVKLLDLLNQLDLKLRSNMYTPRLIVEHYMLKALKL